LQVAILSFSLTAKDGPVGTVANKAATISAYRYINIPFNCQAGIALL